MKEFSCSSNLEVENFLHNTAIRFEKADKTRTYLLTTESFQILGYFTLSIKSIDIPEGTSKTFVKKLDGINKNAKKIVGYLIGQLGKNDNCSNLISGHELLVHALNTIYECFKLVGVKSIFVECQNNKKLVKFYTDNKFKSIGVNKNNGLLQFARITIKDKNSDYIYIFKVKIIEKI